MDMEKKEVHPGVFVVEFSGSIHMGPECAKIDRLIEEHVRDKQLNVIFDLTRVTHIDSSVIGVIVRAHSQLKKAGGRLRIAVGSGMVERALVLTQLHRVISLHPTAAEASADCLAAATKK
ncbi:MAG: STAS domain-containing protein [Candidatus Acidiferrales bacterium]